MKSPASVGQVDVPLLAGRPEAQQLSESLGYRPAALWVARTLRDFLNPWLVKLQITIYKLQMLSPAVHGRFHAHAIRFGFQGVVLHHGGAAAKRIPDASGALLENVGQFMAEQLLSLDAVRVVMSGSEVNV